MTDYKLVPVERLKDWHKRINTIAVETAFDVADEMGAMLEAAAPDVQGELYGYVYDGQLLCDEQDFVDYFDGAQYDISTMTPVYTAAPAAVPEGYAILPKELTAENGAKKLLIGEFYSGIEVPCPDCEGGDGSEDYDCGFCNSSGTVTERVPVSWTTIKEIWRKAAIALAAPQPAPDVAELKRQNKQPAERNKP